MEQTKALNALEPFLALAKSATSPRAATDLITRATSAPSTFIFTELLLAPQIQALKTSPEHAAHLQLLSIYCCGSYDTYTSTTDILPPLNDAQSLKLRQLSLLTLAQDPGNLTYKNLISVLGLSDARGLEDLVISAIYAGLISGTLDPYSQRVNITSCAPLRDVSPASVPVMLATLKEWSDRCLNTLSGLEKHIATIKGDAVRRNKADKDWDKYVGTLLEPESASGATRKGHKTWDAKNNGRVLGTTEEDTMDVDEVSEHERAQAIDSTRLAKKRGFGGAN